MSTNHTRQNASLIAVGFLLTFWSSPGQTFFISLFGDNIRELLSLNHAQFGSLYSISDDGKRVTVALDGNARR